MTEYTVVACARVTAKPLVLPGSEQENCSVCEALIWVAPTSPKEFPRLCLECAVIHAENEPDEDTAKLLRYVIDKLKERHESNS